MRSSWHFSTSGFNIRFPRTPSQIKTKLITNFDQITSIFYMSLEDSFGVKSISKCSWGYEAYIKCLWVLFTHVYWFRPTGGYGCGRQSNLVKEEFLTTPRDGMWEYRAIASISMALSLQCDGGTFHLVYLSLHIHYDCINCHWQHKVWYICNMTGRPIDVTGSTPTSHTLRIKRINWSMRLSSSRLLYIQMSYVPNHCNVMYMYSLEKRTIHAHCEENNNIPWHWLEFIIH